MKKMVFVKVERCLGCKSCELACAVEHSAAGEPGAILRFGERPGYRIAVEACGPRAVPVHCHHCEEAACVKACPTGAVYRKSDDSPVLVDVERCIGCRMCVQACPFGVIAAGAEGKGVLKCDLCAGRLEKGMEPACVSACPTMSLVYCEEEEFNRNRRRKAAEKAAAAAPD